MKRYPYVNNVELDEVVVEDDVLTLTVRLAGKAGRFHLQIVNCNPATVRGRIRRATYRGAE